MVDADEYFYTMNKKSKDVYLESAADAQILSIAMVRLQKCVRCSVEALTDRYQFYKRGYRKFFQGGGRVRISDLKIQQAKKGKWRGVSYVRKPISVTPRKIHYTKGVITRMKGVKTQLRRNNPKFKCVITRIEAK